jgi:hypothetical protein
LNVRFWSVASLIATQRSGHYRVQSGYRAAIAIRLLQTQSAMERAITVFGALAE